MVSVIAALHYRVDGSTGLAAVLRVVGVRHDFELFHRVNGGGDVPGAGSSSSLCGDGRSIQRELILGAGLSVDGVGVGLIPGARAGVAARTKGGCGEASAGGEAEQAVKLAAIEREVLDLLRIEDGTQ